MRRFGDLILEEGLVTQEQLQSAIEIQSHSRLRVGEIMLKHGVLRDHHVHQILEHQKDTTQQERFGEIALKLAIINHQQLAEAIYYQRTSKGLLGDILVELGHLKMEDCLRIVQVQIQDLS